ncbi:flagellar hook-associated protein FlgL [Arcobacter sp. YIC-464]|uniref:flagellar hook-associated protein FlgL n=1 Tax=Arcobacter sp. YIC-464 TaxID=3376631 RepID=UPI003C28900E
MINQTEITLHRLDKLNAEQQRISYQTSTGKKIDDGSDDAVLFTRQIFVEDKIRTFEGIQDQLNKTTVHNNVSDSAIGEIKTLLEQVKSELLKANTDTTTDEGKKAIAVSIAGVKQNILDLANTKIDGEYLFSGSDSSIASFTEDPVTGKVSYNGDNHLRKIAVDEGSYREKGVNGFDMMMFSTDIATKADTLEFSTSQRIVDQDGFEWKPDSLTTPTKLVRYDFNGNPTTDELTVSANGGANAAKFPYQVTTPNVDGTKFEAKTNIFDEIDNVVNALNKVDSNGNPVSDAVADAALTEGLENINSAFDAVNVAHAELGGRNRVFEISEEKVSAKLTQYNILFQEIGAADLSKVAVEAKALELTFTALYSTINKTNELSLVNFIR